MYRIEDKVSAIEELQRLLDLTPTGLFDKNTREAVLRTQAKNSLEQTGIVDYLTFTFIVEEYRSEKNNQWNSDYLFDPRFPYIKGDMGDNVLRINEALETVLRDYSYEGTMPRGKYLGEDTIDGVRFLQKIFNMRESDMIDEALLSRVMKERESIEIKKPRD